MVRASLVCASLYGRMAAACAASMSANPNAPSVVPAKPALAPTKKWRRESSMFMRPVLHQNVLPPPGDVQLRTALAARPDQREFRDRLQGKFGEYAESNKHVYAKSDSLRSIIAMYCNITACQPL